jgi:hypothetical protein
MPKKRYRGYAVEFSSTASTMKEAKELAQTGEAEGFGSPTITALALDECPGQAKPPHYTMDHAHARYDGDRWCPYCEARL